MSFASQAQLAVAHSAARLPGEKRSGRLLWPPITRPS